MATVHVRYAAFLRNYWMMPHITRFPRNPPNICAPKRPGRGGPGSGGIGAAAAAELSWPGSHARLDAATGLASHRAKLRLA